MLVEMLVVEKKYAQKWEYFWHILYIISADKHTLITTSLDREVVQFYCYTVVLRLN